jgi:hypothetical protein
MFFGGIEGRSPKNPSLSSQIAHSAMIWRAQQKRELAFAYSGFVSGHALQACLNPLEERIRL